MPRHAETAATQDLPDDRPRDASPGHLVLTIAAHPSLDRVGQVAVLGPIDATGGPVGAVLSRLGPDFGPARGGQGAYLGDASLSRSPLVEVAADGHGGAQVTRVHGSVRLALDGVALEARADVRAEALERGVVLELGHRVVLVLHQAWVPVRAGPDHGMVGEGDEMQALRVAIDRVARTDLPALIRGETGTGKELVAQALHRASSRAAGPFVAVNMAAVSPELAASELFGHVRGAFSGATTDRRGRFREAEGGTLFLDEVGDTPEPVQTLLLRALEARAIRPVGGERDLPVDVRVVAATDTDLETAVERGRFRPSLLHRLAGFRIAVAPLRRRREDIGRLVTRFVRDEAEAAGAAERLVRHAEHPWLPARTVAALVRHDWPGNVRELRNAVRAMVLAGLDEAELRVDPALIPDVEAPKREDRAARAEPSAEAGGPAVVTEDQLLDALRAEGFRREAAAKRLGIARSTLYAMMDRSARVRKVGDLGSEEIGRALADAEGRLADAARALEVSEKGLKLRIGQLGLDAPARRTVEVGAPPRDEAS